MSIVHTLSNGLRIVADRAPGAVSYIGIAVNAGSREDGTRTPGRAHFVEHTIFKGTRSRSSWQISNRLESVGGELNAYTSKEETVIYTNAPTGYADRAFELLSDLVANATFPEAEVSRERDVIIEEIHSYRDNPADAVYDEFDDHLYAGTKLGHNILGTEESVSHLTGTDAAHFVKDYYTPDNMVIYCRDAADPERSIRRAEKYFGHLSGISPAKRQGLYERPMAPNFSKTEDRGNIQANTVMGCRLFGRTDPRRHALFLLNNYLGGPCMNSLLNRELRDRRGLVYTVDSNVALMSDTGALLIYFGSDPKSVIKCTSLIAKNIIGLAEHALAPKTFEKILRQYCGQLTVSSDHIENNAMSMAKSLLYYNEVHDINYTIERMRSVTPEQLRQVAELIATTGLSRLTLR